MIVFNYIFLKKLNGFIGFITSVSISSLIFVTDILLVQYSQTAVTLCVAGVVLGYAACTMESKKSYRVWQILCSVLLIVVSSMIRIAPFLVSMAFSVLFVFCLIIQRLAKNKSNNLKNKIVFGCRKSLSLILIVLVSLSMSVGFYWLAGLVLPTDKDSLDYNAARTAVVDYRILPYEGNESFYSEVGINSDIELSMIGFDKEQYNTQMLKRIAEHSEQVLYGGKPKIVFATYSVFDRAINSAKKLYRMVNHIKNACGLKINDRLLSVIILFLCLLFISVAIIVIRTFLKKYNIKINRRRLCFNIIIILIWTVLFFLIKIDNRNYLFIILFAIVLCAMIYKIDDYFSIFVFSLAPALLYLYQMNFRISLRVAYTFLFPSIIFLLLLVSGQKNNAVKMSCEGRNHKILGVVLSSVLIIGSFGLSCAWICCYYYPGLSVKYDLQLRRYMESNPETVFICDIHSNGLVDQGYNNVWQKPDIPRNEIVTTGWIMITDYYSNILSKKGMTDVLYDAVNSNSRIVLTEYNEGYLNEAKKNYENYYNTHYFSGENIITLQPEKLFMYTNSTGIKKAVTFKIVKQR